MLNRKMSAGTAAQKSSKISLLARLSLLLAILLLCAFSGQSQLLLNDSTPLVSTGIIGVGVSAIDSNIIGGSYFGVGGSYFGYHPSNIFDTIPAVLLITECDNCLSKSISGYFIQQKQTYWGDRMPPGNYDDYWSIIGNLNSNKKPFDKGIRIWQGVAK